MAGDRMKALVDGQGQVYRFDSILGLSQEEVSYSYCLVTIYVSATSQQVVTGFNSLIQGSVA